MHDSSRTLIPRARGCPKRIKALKQDQLWGVTREARSFPEDRDHFPGLGELGQIFVDIIVRTNQLGCADMKLEVVQRDWPRLLAFSLLFFFLTLTQVAEVFATDWLWDDAILRTRFVYGKGRKMQEYPRERKSGGIYIHTRGPRRTEYNHALSPTYGTFAHPVNWGGMVCYVRCLISLRPWEWDGPFCGNTQAGASIRNTWDLRRSRCFTWHLLRTISWCIVCVTATFSYQQARQDGFGSMQVFLLSGLHSYND